MMKTRDNLFWISLLAVCLALSACQPETPQPEALVQTPAFPSSELPNTVSTEVPTLEPQVAHGELLISDDLGVDSPFCEPEPASNTFSVNCLGNVLSIDQADGRRKVDILIMREMPVELGSFSLEVETLSNAAKKTRSDQNIYGFYFMDESGLVHSLRLTSQYFSFETWSRNGKVKVEEKTNPAFSPAIRSAGQGNTLRLDCSAAGCDFFANGKLAGRSPIGVSGKTKTIGLFASSNWDQRFGKVEYKQLHVYAFTGDKDAPQSYSVEDPLTSASEIFAGTGLSGAFNKYDAEGFHFSPVIPYGFYGVKGGPALGDMTVSATIKMEVAPGVSGSRFAGLVCHSSLDGMIMAVIRADGTYSIYRDTPRQPFALLAQKKSPAILPGLVENKIRLDCVGDQITFLINGAQVESLTNSRYELRYGRAGLFTKAGGTTEPDAIIFNDFSITEIR